jgi:TRAP-type mannitol/chloroaromatic compound transport system permease large subunit
MAGAFVLHVVMIAIVRPDLIPPLPPELLRVRGREP